MPSEKRRRSDCSNCGLQLKGDFCSGCGQSAFDYRVSLGRLFKDFFGDYFNLNSRFFRSVRFLLTKPGALTREYLDGRKVSFINPIRIYIVASLIFFVLVRMQTNQFLKTTGSDGIISVSTDSNEDAEEDPSVVLVDSTAMEPANADSVVVPSSKLTKEELKDKVEELGNRVASDPNFRRETILKAMDYIPRSAFLLLPLFALLLKLIYFRRKRLYSEHFVHALHVHSFWFVVALLPLFIGFFAVPLFIALAGFYVLLSLRKVYGQSWIKTLFKTATLLFFYFLCLILVVSLFFFLGGLYEVIAAEGYSFWELWQVIFGSDS